MFLELSKRLARAVPFAIVGAACSGGDGGTTPPAVSVVVITAPAAAPTFGALNRTVQFSAQARDAGGTAVPGAAIAWNSTSGAVASISIGGLVTALANGTTQITASSGGVTSTAMTVTVQQVATQLVIMSNTPLTFGSFNSTTQLAGLARDSGGSNVITPAITWTLIPHAPAQVTVSPAGLVTAVANTPVGLADSIRGDVTVGGVALSSTVTVNVTQLTHTIALSVPAGPDTLRTTTRTRQFSATARDSGGTLLVTQPTFAWTSSVTGVATVGAATGLVTAAGDGSTNIQAAAGLRTGTRTQVVQRYAETFTLAPPNANIVTAGGTQVFNGTAQDSVATNLTISWVARNATGIVTLNPASGTSTTATAQSNGSTYVVMSAGTRSDSALVTTSNQPTAPTMIAVSVGDFFFRSGRNATQNPAVDTLAVNGTVTWTWGGTFPHSVRSTGAPSFPSSATFTGVPNMYSFTFAAVGTYNYDCIVHGAGMTGTIVVR